MTDQQMNLLRLFIRRNHWSYVMSDNAEVFNAVCTLVDLGYLEWNDTSSMVRWTGKVT